MKVKREDETLDLTNKSHIILVHDGDYADMMWHGSKHELAQLIDALVRRMLGDTASA